MHTCLCVPGGWLHSCSTPPSSCLGGKCGKCGKSGDGGERGGLGLEPHLGRLAKQIGDAPGGEVAQRCGAAAVDIFRRERCRLAKRVCELAKGSVELVFEFDHRQITWPTGAGLPDDMQPDAAERGVGVVAVLAPAGGEDVHLDVTLERLGVAHLDECPPEIRPGLEVEEAGMEEGHPPPVGGAEVASADALMLPNGLQ